MNINLILGIDFLTKNDASINLKDLTISLDDKVYEFEESLRQAYPDVELQNKTKIAMSMSSDVKKKCSNMIKEFSQQMPEIGTISKFEHTINLIKDTIICKKPYRVPIGLEKQVKQEIERLKNLNIIRNSQSSFSSPAFPIKKRNGKIRIVVDYRELNKVTAPMAQTFPRITDCLSKIGGSEIFSQLDLNNGYYQIPLENNSRKYTAFSLCDGHYEFNRMPFGLSNAPMTFQRCMLELLKDLKFVGIYLDDILIYSKSPEIHLKHLETVLIILKKNNISLNLEKCNFLTTNVTYLGHNITRRGIQPNTERINNITEIKIKNKRSIQKLLGIINWYRPFIKDITHKCYFLTEKLKSANKVLWTEDDNHKLNMLITEIQKRPLLSYPDLNKPFELFTDASDIAIGAVLKQKNLTIGFFSRKLSNSELNYTICEKEAYAIIKSLEFFRNLILLSEIYIYCDNKNIIQNGDVSKRVNRWKLLMEEYNYKLLNIKGYHNKNADILSRLYETKKEIKDDKNNQGSINILTISNNSEDKRISVSQIASLHKLLMHPGQKSMFIILKRNHYVPKLRNMIKLVVNSCVPCQRLKHHKKEKSNHHLHIIAEKHNELVSSDILGPLKREHFKLNHSERYFYILTPTDIYTKWTEIKIIWTIKTSELIKAFKDIWISNFGPPQKFLSDQGRQYISSEFKDFLNSFKIKHVLASPYNPTGNSVSERKNSIILQVCRFSRGKSIKELTEGIFIRLNTTPNTKYELSPYEILFKETLSGDSSTISKKLLEYDESIKKQKIESETYAENNYNTKIKFKENDLVFRKAFNPDKLQDLWKGPFKVIKVPKNREFVLIEEKSKISRQNIKNIRHFVREESRMLYSQQHDNYQNNMSKLITKKIKEKI
ncbi:Retrovirus-related Pol polyprotein from transposon 17.6, partial [Dictyocoela muelleri]